MLHWDVDDRPRAFVTRAYVLGMRMARDKRAFEGARHTLLEARRRQRKGDAPPTWLTRLRCRVTTTTAAGMTLWIARPRRQPPVARILYLHGGGYVHPLTADYWRLVRSLTRVPAEVVVPGYPLAPTATVDDVLPRLGELVRSVSGTDLPVVVMGDSAGGALSLVVADQARTRPSRTGSGSGSAIAAVVALCPWLDATLDEPAVRDLEPTDPILAESGLRAAGRWWAGKRGPSDPLVSPLGARLDGLPVIDVYIGDRDILRPAVDNLAERARRDELDLHVHEVTSMFHVWMTRAIPEGRRTRSDLVDLVRARLRSAGAGPDHS